MAALLLCPHVPLEKAEPVQSILCMESAFKVYHNLKKNPFVCLYWAFLGLQMKPPFFWIVKPWYSWFISGATPTQHLDYCKKVLA